MPFSLLHSLFSGTHFTVYSGVSKGSGGHNELLLKVLPKSPAVVFFSTKSQTLVTENQAHCMGLTDHNPLEDGVWLPTWQGH